MSLATGHKNVLSDLSSLQPKYDFASIILPPTNVATYSRAKESFDSMSSALQVYFFKDAIFDRACPQILLKRQLNSTIDCGFVLFLRILGAVYEHMGKLPVDVNQKIKDLTIDEEETYDSLLTKFLGINQEVELSMYKFSNTVVIQKLLDLLMTIPETFSQLSPICIQLTQHISHHGPKIDFSYTVKDVYDLSQKSGIDTTQEIPCKTYSYSKPTPQAYEAIVDSTTPNLLPTTHSKNTVDLVPRHNCCPICYLRHDALKCWPCGGKFQPIWLCRNIMKYNALHKHDAPDPTLISAPPPLLRHATTK